MKKILLLAFAAVLAVSANAQIFSYGIKGGINHTNPNISNMKIGDYKLFNDQSEIGYQFGAFARVKVLMLYIQPEFNYSVQKSRINIQHNGGIVNGSKYQVNTFNIPILVGFKLGPVRLNAGPMYTKYIKTRGAVRDLEGVDFHLNNSGWGYAAGVGVDLFKVVTADLRYEGSFDEQSYLKDGDIRRNLSKPRNLSITLGFFL